MYGVSVDNREHQPNSIRYRILAKNYFNPSQNGGEVLLSIQSQN